MYFLTNGSAITGKEYSRSWPPSASAVYAIVHCRSARASRVLGMGLCRLFEEEGGRWGGLQNKKKRLKNIAAIWGTNCGCVCQLDLRHMGSGSARDYGLTENISHWAPLPQAPPMHGRMHGTPSRAPLPTSSGGLSTAKKPRTERCTFPVWNILKATYCDPNTIFFWVMLNVQLCWDRLAVSLYLLLFSRHNVCLFIFILNMNFAPLHIALRDITYTVLE